MMLNGREIGIIILLLFLAFFTAASLVPSKTLIELVRIVHISVLIAVLISYVRPGFRALTKRYPSGSHIMLIGITLSVIADLAFSLWMLLWRLSGQQAWLVNGDAIGFIIAMSSVAWLCFLAAPDALEGHIPPRNMVIIGAAVGSAVLMIGAILIYGADFGWLAEWLKQYLYNDEPTGYGRRVMDFATGFG